MPLFGLLGFRSFQIVFVVSKTMFISVFFNKLVPVFVCCPTCVKGAQFFRLKVMCGLYCGISRILHNNLRGNLKSYIVRCKRWRVIVI
jgi:hypothetical protein